MDLILHHTGIAVKSIDADLEHYSALFGKENISSKIHIASQQVNVCFIHIGNNVHFELVEPVGDDSVVNGFIERGITYYHSGFLTKNIENTIKELEKIGYRSVNQFNSEAFNNKRCVFLLSPQRILIELIEEE